MIYVPNLNYACYVVHDKDTIRAYKNAPGADMNVSYRDFYINSHYIYKDGKQQFNSYSTIPICLDSDILTNDFYYRNDFDSILIIFLIMTIFIIYIPVKVFLRLFKRGAL